MIYVLSDIHGNERRFASVMNQIDLQPEDTLYVLGDVIDRHPSGIRILRKLMAMPNAKMLLGNHEYMMLRALGYPYDSREEINETIREDALKLWYRNGGKVTHDYLKHLRKTVRSQIVEYLRSLPLNIDISVGGKAYKLAHSAPVEEYINYRGHPDSTHFAVWKRWRRYDTFSGAYTLIFGHTPTMYYQNSVPMEIWTGDRCMGIDCGCGFSEDKNDPDSKYGRLACLRVDDGKVFYSEEKEFCI